MIKTYKSKQLKGLELKQEHSEVINALRFPMAFGVVFLHANFLSADIELKANNFDWTILKYYSVGISILFSITVPLFFIISGYLFFKSFKKEWSWSIYREKLHRRVFTLLIPYLIWNAIGIFGRIQNEYRLGHSLDDYFSGYSLWGFLKHFWQSGVHHEEHQNILNMTCVFDYPANVPLWFMRDLIIMIILAPLFYYIIKKIGGCVPLLLLIPYILGIRLNIQGFSTVAFFFFCLGAWTSLNNINFTNLSVKLLRYLILPTLFFFIVATYAKTFSLKTAGLWTAFYVITGCIISIAITTILQRKRRVKTMLWLASATFFIYVAHCVEYIGANVWSRKLLIALFGTPNNELTAIMLCLFYPILATFLCVVSYNLLAHYFPRFTAIICGGR